MCANKFSVVSVTEGRYRYSNFTFKSFKGRLCGCTLKTEQNKFSNSVIWIYSFYMIFQNLDLNYLLRKLVLETLLFLGKSIELFQ